MESHWAFCLVFGLVWRAGAVLAQQPIVIKLGNVQEVRQTVQTGLKRFGDLVGERTKGQIQVQVFPASPTRDRARNPRRGAARHRAHVRGKHRVGRGASSRIWRPSPLPTSGVTRTTCSRRSGARSGRSWRSAWSNPRECESWIRWLFGNRYLTTKNKAIYKPEDLKGMRIRVQPTAIYLDTIRGMGANSAPRSTGKRSTSNSNRRDRRSGKPAGRPLQREAVEVQKYVMLTAHTAQTQAIVINEKFYQSLSPEFRKILTDASYEAGNFQNELVLKSEWSTWTS